MKELDELIEHYGLEEDKEYVIIPYTDKSGKKKRCYLLKRRYIRIIYSEEHAVDYPLTDAIEATIRHPEIPLSESLYLLYKELDMKMPEGIHNDKDSDEESDGISEEGI